MKDVIMSKIIYLIENIGINYQLSIINYQFVTMARSRN